MSKKLLYIFLGFTLASIGYWGYTKLSEKSIVVEDIVENSYSTSTADPDGSGACWAGRCAA